jgi:hypothetical protein
MTEGSVSRFPLQWPIGWKRAKYRKHAAFTTKKTSDGRLSMAIATERLEDELRRLGARDATLSSNIALRLDGRPRSDGGLITDPGVAVYFSHKGRATVLACDAYFRVEDNVAAIAAHVEAIRAIGRYGVGSLEQALAGYKALPADTAADWRAVLNLQGRPSRAQLEDALREAQKKHHPDRGGSTEAWHQAQRAFDYATDELGL